MCRLEINQQRRQTRQMAPWTHLALKVSGLVGVLLMVYVVLVPRGTLERLAAQSGGGVVSSISTGTTQVTLHLSALTYCPRRCSCDHPNTVLLLRRVGAVACVRTALDI